jgi:hypothetical protein
MHRLRSFLSYSLYTHLDNIPLVKNPLNAKHLLDVNMNISSYRQGGSKLHETGLSYLLRTSRDLFNPQFSSRMQAETRAKELQKLNVKVRILTVGKKGNVYFKRRADKYELAGECLKSMASRILSPASVGLRLVRRLAGHTHLYLSDRHSSSATALNGRRGWIILHSLRGSWGALNLKHRRCTFDRRTLSGNCHSSKQLTEKLQCPRQLVWGWGYSRISINGTFKSQLKSPA